MRKSIGPMSLDRNENNNLSKNVIKTTLFLVTAPNCQNFLRATRPAGEDHRRLDVRWGGGLLNRAG